MSDYELKQRVDKFIDQYDKGEKKLKKEAEKYNMSVNKISYTIPTALADAILDYRKVNKNPREDDYGSKIRLKETVNYCLKVIEFINAHDLLDDNKIAIDLQKSQEHCKSLGSQHDKDQTTIKTLEHKVTELKTLIRTFKHVHPDLEVAIPESELEDGESSSM